MTPLLNLVLFKLSTIGKKSSASEDIRRKYSGNETIQTRKIELENNSANSLKLKVKYKTAAKAKVTKSFTNEADPLNSPLINIPNMGGNSIAKNNSIDSHILFAFNLGLVRIIPLQANKIMPTKHSEYMMAE
jgi:hypothetical protein